MAVQPATQPTRLALGEVDPAQPLDPTHPLTRGLEGFWLPLPRLVGGERLYDLSANKIHGDFIDSPTWSFGAERIFSHLSYDGSNDSVDISSKDLPLTRYSVFAWMKTNTAGASGGDGILSRRDGDGISQDFSYNLLLNSSGKIDAGHHDGNSFVTPESTTTVSDGLWHYVGVTYDGAIIRVFVDGVVEASASAGDPYTGTADQLIGQNNYPGNYFQGDIGEVSLHSRGFDEPVGKRLYHQARRGFPDLRRRRDESALYVSTAGATVTESAALQAQASLAATDTALGSESAAISAVGSLSASESASTDEAASLSATGSLSASDMATATEQAAVSSTATLDANETATVTEAVSVGVSAAWSVTEAVGSTVTEAATLAVTTSLSATETSSASESAQVSSQASLAAKEASTATEAVQLVTQAKLDAQESTTVTEAVTLTAEAAADVIEDATATEAATVAAAATWSIAETTAKLVAGRVSEVGKNAVELLTRPFNQVERKD